MDASEDKGNFFVVHLHLKKVNKKKISVGVCMISEKLFMSACCFHTTHRRCSLMCSELEGSFSAPSPLQNLSMPCWHQADLVLLPRGPGGWARQYFSSSSLLSCSGTAGVGAGHLLHWALEGKISLFHSLLLIELVWNLLLITEVWTSGSVPTAIDAESFISSARLLHKPFKNAALIWVRQHGKTFFSAGHGSLLPPLKKTSCSVHVPYFLHAGTMLRC